MIKVLDEIRIQSGVGERKFVKGNNGTLVDVDVGINLLEWGEYDEAERVLGECLDSVTSNEQATDAEILKAQSAMAALFRAQGKYEEAKDLYLEAMKVARRIEIRTSLGKTIGTAAIVEESISSSSPDEPLEIDISIINVSNLPSCHLFSNFRDINHLYRLSRLTLNPNRALQVSCNDMD